jgi:hypothetical protein
MDYRFSIDIACAVGVGDLAASVVLADGSHHDVVLTDGQLDATFSARPRQLTIDTALPGNAAAPPDDVRAPAADAEQVEADTLFGRPLDIPDSGRLAYDVIWDCECHGELHLRDPSGRFGSYEHIQCAFWIGRMGTSDKAAVLTSPFKLLPSTPLQLLGRSIRFGELICLAGDFFAHLDRECADRFADAWPPLPRVAGWLLGPDYRSEVLLDADGAAVKALLATIHRDGTGSRSTLGEALKTATDTALHRYPARRYLALASQNYCHFGSPDPSIKNEALELYRGYHQLACERAAAAGNDGTRWTLAVATEAFACHFLTDLFATGHMRTPRRALGECFGVLRGSLRMSKAMHDEDNEVGLWCTTMVPAAGPRVVWRGFGDGKLLDPDAFVHLLQVQEAVRRSVWELYEAHAGRPVAADQRAECLVPVPLAPGRGPLPTDVFPDGQAHAEPASPNHAPLYALLRNGHVGERQADGVNYRDLEDRSGALVTPFA